MEQIKIKYDKECNVYVASGFVDGYGKLYSQGTTPQRAQEAYNDALQGLTEALRKLSHK